MMTTTDGDMKVGRLEGRGGDDVMIWYDDNIVMAHADDFLIKSHRDMISLLVCGQAGSKLKSI